MITSLRKRSVSLTRNTISNTITPVISSGVSFSHISTVNQFNNQFYNLYNELNIDRMGLQNQVIENLRMDSTFKGLRNSGVKLAWAYEKADIQMGGSGTENWSAEQKIEILSTGKVRGVEGHHINNVADYNELQANPDNIKFYQTREEHQYLGHKGNFQNSSNGELIDRNELLKNTNNKRIHENYIRGLKLSAAIGFISGFTISAIIELSRVGIKNADLKKLLLNSLKTGIEVGALSSATYVVTTSASTVLNKLGLEIGTFGNFAIVGLLSIAISTTYTIAKMKFYNIDDEIIADSVIKQTGLSLATMALYTLASLAFGNVAGVIVSIGTTIFYVANTAVKNVKQRRFNEKLSEYVVEVNKPIYLV